MPRDRSLLLEIMEQEGVQIGYRGALGIVDFQLQGAASELLDAG